MVYLPLVSSTTIFPSEKSNLPNLKLTVSDLQMLSCHYIQKGCLFSTEPSVQIQQLLSGLKHSLSQTLSHFPPLAGRLITHHHSGHVYIACNDDGAAFTHADGSHIHVSELLDSADGDLPEALRGFFALDSTVSSKGHFRPILAVQVTELADGVFVGCSVNHAVCDGTSFWNFFNSFAEVCRGSKTISRVPDFSRDSILVVPAALRLPEMGPAAVGFSGGAPVRERIFRFSRESMLKLKNTVNNQLIMSHSYYTNNDDDEGGVKINTAETTGKRISDPWKVNEKSNLHRHEISSFQSLCALLWRVVTRARNPPPTKTTTFRMAVNCRHRLDPELKPTYFGNAIQSFPTRAASGEVVSNDLWWCADRLHRSVVAHGDAAVVRRYVEEWKKDPRCYPLGNPDGSVIAMGSGSRFPMYENDFGWGRPSAVRSGRANKFDGKVSAFPGRAGDGSVELEVVLAPETMEGILGDGEFMQYVDQTKCD